jgi:PAS domain-containing protein
MTSSILSGEDIEVFENRYRKKKEGIAYNLWSARWDAKAKLMFCVRDGRKTFEQEEIMLKSERFKALVQEGYDLIGIDAEGNYTYVSPTSTAILGIRRIYRKECA